MPKLSVYNQGGQVVSQIELSEAIFAIKPDPSVVHEVLIAQQANARRSIASTKTRGQVRGGGKKPWKQKGTGRARQGSTRSPQWVGGGIAFGPTSARNWAVKVNKKLKRKALFMALTDKVQNNKLLVLDQVATEPAKTKVIAQLWKQLPLDKDALFIAPSSQPVLLRMLRNLPQAKLVSANTVNLNDVLAYRSIVFLKDAVPAFEKLYVS